LRVDRASRAGLGGLRTGLLGLHGDRAGALQREVDLLGLLKTLAHAAQRPGVVSIAEATIGGTNGRIQRTAVLVTSGMLRDQ